MSNPRLNSSTPITIIRTVTISPERYSYLPWPYGCSSSAGLLAILKPNRLMILEEASERLFTASAVMDTEPEIVPIIILPRKSKTLHRIPTVLENLPYAVRTDAHCTFSESLINFLIKRFIMVLLLIVLLLSLPHIIRSD
ncbi:hypothetical protein SDC9_125621 [bioreactor metagenome]|uniref:Uncharacterized protein n=1 Tax=bioreactor metagenome TaxID=1076179 RepID=A0A645CNH9_9ZZZZ